MSGARYDLFRKAVDRSGHEYQYRLELDGSTVVSATSSGRLLLGSAEIEADAGAAPLRLSPTRRFAPKQWQLSDPDRGDLATFAVSYRKRGSTTIEMHADSRRVTLESVDSAIRDLLKAAALLDSDDFVLRDNGEVIATIGRPSSGRKKLIERARNRISGDREERPAETMQIIGDSGWTPDAAFACAILLFKDRVVEEFRSP